MSWPITTSNSAIRDPITPFDIIPDGVAVVWDPVTEEVSLPADPAWRSSNLIPFGMGESADGHSLIFHNSLTMYNTIIRMSVDGGPWRQTTEPGTFSFTPSGFNGLPTAYRGAGDNYIYVAYDEVLRRWYHGFSSQEPAVDLSVVAVSRGVPFWMGKPTGPYIVHGIYEDVDDVDIWGGWVDHCDMMATLVTAQGSKVFYGDLLVDREYHRTFWGAPSAKKPASFSAMSMAIPGVLDMTVIQTVNPIDGSPEYEGVPFQHTARLNFLGAGQDFAFDNFVYEDDGKIPADNYRITGDFAEGSVDLAGKAFRTFAWDNPTDAWYSHEKVYWGRTFVVWNGFISAFDGPLLEVEGALGFAEFTRVGSPNIGPLIVGGLVVGGAIYALGKGKP